MHQQQTFKLYTTPVYYTILQADLGPIHKVKSIIMSLNFSSSQLTRISLAEFVSKLILI